MIELEELTIGHLCQYVSGSMYRLMAVAECEETNKPTAVYQSVTSSKVWDGEDQDVDWLSDTAPNEFKESHITHWMPPLPAHLWRRFAWNPNSRLVRLDLNQKDSKCQNLLK